MLGRKFIVRSNCKALTWLFSMQEPNVKIARWIEILSTLAYNTDQEDSRGTVMPCPDVRTQEIAVVVMWTLASPLHVAHVRVSQKSHINIV
jgi:hypothetical protein